MAENSPFPAAGFQYRHNRDGSWDSICLQCFMTVGTASSVEELAEMEAVHSCYTKKPPKPDRPATK